MIGLKWEEHDTILRLMCLNNAQVLTKYYNKTKLIQKFKNKVNVFFLACNTSYLQFIS